MNVENQQVQNEQGKLGLEQQKQSMESPEQGNPEVKAAQDDQLVQGGNLDLASKEQKMRHAEEIHSTKLKSLKSRSNAAPKEKK